MRDQQHSEVASVPPTSQGKRRSVSCSCQGVTGARKTESSSGLFEKERNGLGWSPTAPGPTPGTPEPGTAHASDHPGEQRAKRDCQGQSVRTFHVSCDRFLGRCPRIGRCSGRRLWRSVRAVLSESPTLGTGDCALSKCVQGRPPCRLLRLDPWPVVAFGARLQNLRLTLCVEEVWAGRW